VLASSLTGSVPVKNVEPNGLTSDEARLGLERDGPNTTPDAAAHPVRNAVIKFLGAASLVARSCDPARGVAAKGPEAAVIAALLIHNAAFAWFQEGHAEATLAALKSRLALVASVRRDGVWKTVPAAELVRSYRWAAWWQRMCI